MAADLVTFVLGGGTQRSTGAQSRRVIERVDESLRRNYSSPLAKIFSEGGLSSESIEYLPSRKTATSSRSPATMKRTGPHASEMH